MMTIDEKFDLIIDLEAELPHFSSGYALIIHAILNSIDIYDLIGIQLGGGVYKSARIQSNILKRLRAYNKPSKLFKYLYALMDTGDYRVRTNLRIYLREMLPALKKTEVEQYFSLFINSKYTHEFNDALACMSLIWSKELGETLYEKFLELHDIRLFETWLKNSSEIQVATKAQEIWPFLPQRIKTSVIKKVGNKYYLKMFFLRDVDSPMFMYLVTNFANSMKVTDHDVSNFMEQADPSMLPFTLLTLSKLGKWEKIESIIKDIVNDPKKPFQYFDPYLGSM